MPPPRGARPMNREDFKKNPISKGLVKKLMSYTTGKYKALLGIVILCIIVASVTSVLGNMFIKNLIDDYIVPILKTKTETGAADFSGLLKWIRMVAILFGFGVIANLVQGQVMLVISNNVLRNIRGDMFKHMQTLPISYFDTHSHGDVMSHYTNDVDTLRQMISQSFPQMISSGITIVATLAAMYLKDFSEAAGVMLFYQIGEYFQDLAVARSRRSIGALMDIRPDHALVSRNGGWISVSPEEVRTGEIIQVRPGEKIPLDGIIVKGASSLDTAGLTGESEPRDVDVNDAVYSGTVNINGVLEIRTVKEYGESTVSKILDLVENQESRKSSHENFITRFSLVYTPTVVFAAVAVAILTGIFTHDFHEGIYRACTFLVISCPCALVISIPLSFFAGIGGLSSHGVLVKGANLIEPLAKTDIVVFDKTGTLTSGVFAVEETLHAEDKDKLLEDAAYAEYYSNHPIAAGIRAAYGKEIDPDRIQNAAEIAGRGLSAELDGRKILAGNLKLMKENGIECPQEETAGTLVYVASEGKYEGCLVLRDQIREDTEGAVKELQAAGKKCMIISGDHQAVTDMIAQKIGADGAYGDCLPQDKVSHVTELMKTGNTAFVGDGVNDAPVLATADTGIAMGGMGSDAAIECADVVIMDDRTSKVALAVKAAQRILTVANQNIYGAICIKILTLILGAFGIANMWMAIFADTGVAMLCVINAMRLLRIGRA